MRRKKSLTLALLFIISLLFSGGCSRTVEQTDQGGITIAARFGREGGAPLSGGTVRLSDGVNGQDYLADQEGALRISGLPAQGELEVAVLDEAGETLGQLTLVFARGAVIDAVTDENSVGHVTLKEDTQEITLKFTLYDSGALECGLQLSESRIA